MLSSAISIIIIIITITDTPRSSLDRAHIHHHRVIRPPAFHRLEHTLKVPLGVRVLGVPKTHWELTFVDGFSIP